ncbi:MAG: hypothetical protein U9N57_10190 [Pseudomonadota bacterium]|nr:hypothetical protein [Pseudomonadota bacterium]
MADSIIEPSEVMLAEQLSSESFNAELMDIELPIEPGFDWLAFWHMGSMLFIAILILAGLVYLLRYSQMAKNGLVSSPFILRWQLLQLKRILNNESHTNLAFVPQETLGEFYLWNQNLNKLLAKTCGELEEGVIQELLELNELSEYMAFSDMAVSRETYYQALQEAQILANKTLSFQVVFRCLFKRFIARGHQ